MNDDAGEIVDGAGGTVVAGDPLRVFQGERTCGYRYLQASMQQMAGSVGEVYVQRNRGGCLRMATPG
jgi:hypothetical protein